MMSTNIEIEAKALVSETDFLKLKAFLQADETTITKQTNYYIDTTEGDLRKYGFALRIRAIGQQFTLTLKSPMAEGSLEKNQSLNIEAYALLKESGVFPKGDMYEFLEMFGFPVNQLRIVASLTTERIDTLYQGFHVCLDKNTYNTIVDYEIESEQSSIKYAAETLQKLCAEAGVTYTPNNVSKYARALMALQ